MKYLAILLFACSVNAQTYVMSKMSIQPLCTNRLADGTATGWTSNRLAWRPELAKYCNGYQVFSGFSSGKQWALVIVKPGVAISPNVATNASVRVIPDSRLDRVLNTANARNSVSNWLADTDIPPMNATASTTTRDVLAHIGQQLGHTSGFTNSLR